MPTPEKKDLSELLTCYYTELYSVCQQLNLTLIDPRFVEYSRKANITLTRVYQELEAVPESEDREDPNDANEIHRFQKQNRQTLLSAVAKDPYKKLVIKGDVGSGKSMFVDYLAGLIAASHIGETNSTLPAVYQRVPVVRLPLRSIAMQLTGGSVKNDFLARAMQDEIETLCGETLDDSAWESIKNSVYRRGVILLDGLDEVPKTEKIRKTLIIAVNKLREQLEPDARLIITNRPYVFDDQEHNLQGFEYLLLLDMRDEQIEDFLNRWYALMRVNRSWSEQEARQKASHLY